MKKKNRKFYNSDWNLNGIMKDFDMSKESLLADLNKQLFQQSNGQFHVKCFFKWHHRKQEEPGTNYHIDGELPFYR